MFLLLRFLLSLVIKMLLLLFLLHSEVFNDFGVFSNVISRYVAYGMFFPSGIVGDWGAVEV